MKIDEDQLGYNLPSEFFRIGDWQRQTTEPLGAVDAHGMAERLEMGN